MSERYTVTLDVEVNDPQALWRKTRDYLIDAGNMQDGQESDDVIGSEAEPDVGACLQMLLDRSEHLDGAEIEQSYSESADTF